MKCYEVSESKQLELLEGRLEMKKQSAKRVNIVSLKLVKELSILYKNRCVISPEDSYQLLKQFVGEVDREYFVVACLDTKNQPTSLNVCHIGSLNASLVHTREVMKPAILSNAASNLVGHNHPSGKSAESKKEVEVTKRLVEAGKIIGIYVIDHIVMGDGEYVSLKEKAICERSKNNGLC
jgi:DNA repair protein RadC